LLYFRLHLHLSPPAGEEHCLDLTVQLLDECGEVAVIFQIGHAAAVCCVGREDCGEKGTIGVQRTPERLCRPQIYLFTASLAIAVSRRSALLSGHPR
jgi:hypothetical protein